MKKLLLIILIGLFSFQGFAQDPDPELFRTWYLYFVQATDIDTPYEVSEIDPAIQPYITILEDLSFTGEGACNFFDGIYEHSGTNEMLAITFNETNEDCGFQNHNSFENSYFGFMQYGFWYNISQESDGLTLSLETPLMGGAIFKEFPLSVIDNAFNTVKIYPNPVSNILYISSDNTIIKKMVVYSITGKVVLEKNSPQSNSLDVSGLSKGMYFLELTSASGKTVKKFIKK